MPFSIAGPSYASLPSLDGINKASDSISSGQRNDYLKNSAEAAISGRLDTAIGEETISIRNATNQISALQKADQSLGQASELIERVQALSVQSGNGALSTSDQEVIANQSQTNLNEAVDLLTDASFNGNSLFDTAGIDIESLQAKLTELRDTGAPLDQDALNDIQDSINVVRAEVGAEQNATISEVEALQEDIIINSNTRSELTDTDFAEEFTNLLKEELLFKANVEVFNHRQLAEQSIVNLLTE